jgi:ankyrin repeat protein
MASLKDLATAAEIRHAINNLRQGSDSYQSAYETAIQRIQGQSVSRTKLANKVLAWIVYAKRVLTASELRLALGVEIGKRHLDYDSCPDVDMMVSVCAGLVTIDESADTIRLVHYTAQTFFDNVKSTLFPSAEKEIVRVCTAYLSLKIFAKYQHGDGYQSDSASESELDGEPPEQHFFNLNQLVNYNDGATYRFVHSRGTFYKYAAQYWGVHARETPDAHEDVMIFLSRGSYITRAYEAAADFCGYEYWKSALISVDGLHLAAIFGLEQAVEEILRERLSNPDVIINIEPSEHRRTSRRSSAVQNYPDTVKMLLDSGTTLNSVSLDEEKKYKGTTALSVASEKGFEVAVNMLPWADATLDSRRSMGEICNLQMDQRKQSTNSTFCNYPLKSYDEPKRSLQHNLRTLVDLPDKFGWSSLFIASHRGSDKIVDMLLRHGADVNSQSKSTCSPSFNVRENGGSMITSLLRMNDPIQRGSDSNLFSPLYVASAQGHFPVVKTLLYHGAKVDALDKHSFSPLYTACLHGHFDVAKILLQKGANMDAPYHSNRSPLHGAAWYGHTKIVKLLLHYGSLIDPQNYRGSSCLHSACERGHVEIVKMLLEHGETTHLMKEIQLSPIHATIEHGRLEVFNLLIRYGANPNQWRSTKTPLQFAIDLQQQNGASSTLQTMIERLRELGGKTSRELRLQETRELMRKRREENASSAGQQELVDLPGENS